MKKILVLLCLTTMILAALPAETAAEWVEPIPGSETDDKYWHVTYDFMSWWEKNFEAYEPGNSNREPDIIEYKDKLWVVWEGLLVPTTPLEPVAYKGKIYARSYTDRGGEPEWSEIIDITPNAYYSDHTNQKAKWIVYKDILYVIWHSNDRNQKPAGGPDYQFDIMMRSYDGNEMNEFTPTEIISRHGAFGPGGGDQEPRPIIYNNKLYVFWFRENIEEGYSDILYRTFDGNKWSDISVMSDYPNNNTDNLWPSVGVWKDRLYIIWQKSTNGIWHTELVFSYTEDGNTWSPVAPLSRKIDTTRSSFDIVSNLVNYQNPKTGKEELHAIWRTLNSENTPGGPYDFDLISRVFDGDDWGPTREISSKDDKWDDTQPNAIEMDGKLHIFWTTKDNSVSDGKDYDIVRVIFDGESYSEPEIISRTGDRDKVLFDDNEWWNEGDDQWPRAATFTNEWGEERLFLVFWTFDHITGCCADDPDGAKPTIVVTMVEDTDHDKDGYMDSDDACPDDAEEYLDTDKDGHCDGKDSDPEDPLVWVIKDVKDERPDADPLPMYLVLLILIIAAAVLMASRGSKKKSRPMEERPRKRSRARREAEEEE